jgi:nitrous oxidase accessory protein NosD
MRKSAALLLVLVLAASSIVSALPVLPVKGEARTIVVPDDYSTIGAAIKNAGEGDTIYVKMGTYEETTTLTVNKSISLIGEDTANTILNLKPPFGEIKWFYPSGEAEYGYYDGMKIVSDNVKISGFTIVCSTSSIVVSGSGTQIANNNLATGIFLMQGDHRSVIGNIIERGITSESDDTLIANNTLGSLFSTGSNVRLEKNLVLSDNFSHCSFIFDSNHWVEGNVISGQYGMAIRGYGNTVFNNTIINTEIALYFEMDAANNTIFHNNFINNTRQVQMSPLLLTIRTNPSVAVWDKGYGVGGNYWSDYLSKYPNATEIDSSGLGDTPYVIDTYNQDNYPLMRPVDIDLGSIGLPFSISSLVIATVPPHISVLSPINQTYNETSVSLVFTVDKAVNWTSYSLDGKDNVTITGNTTITGLSAGLHNITVYAKDEFENIGVSETIKFTIALVIHVLSPERRTYDTSSIPLNFTVNSALAQITYCLNGEKNSTVSGNTTLNGLANGDYALTAYAKDEAGNVGASETILFTVDVPFPATLVIVSVITVAVVGIGLLVYLKKRKR